MEGNPLLAERHAKVIDLELRIKNMMTESMHSPQTMDKVVTHCEKIMKAADEHKAGLAVLEYEMEQL